MTNLRRAFLFTLLFCAVSSSSTAQPSARIVLPTHYAFQIGDDTTWAQPAYADSGWQRLPLGTFPNKDWQTIGWLRYVLEVDSTLWHEPHGVLLQFRGALEFYLDGELCYRFGQIGTPEHNEAALASPPPLVLTFKPNAATRGGRSQHLVAIRYSTQYLRQSVWAGSSPQFDFKLGELHALTAARAKLARKISAHQMLLMGVNLAFALLHLMLFGFYPKFRSNWYYAILTLAAAFNIYFELAMPLAANPAEYLAAKRGALLTMIAFALSWLRFTYALTYKRAPKIFYAFVLAGSALAVWSWLRPFAANSFILLLMLIAIFELVRALIRARLRARHEETLAGSWIVGLGAIPLVAAAVYQILTALHVMQPWWDFYDLPAPFYGQLSLTLSMSIFLARYFAGINRDLEKQLVHVQELSRKTLEQERQAQAEAIVRAKLEAENARKTKELEEARMLQLSMLPRLIPQVPHLDIAVHMQTATEVGGDYYDVKLAHDGTLDVMIGDATGHGMRAGTMVAATKSVLNALLHQPGLTSIMRETSRALKNMGFRQMYMAMTLARLKQDTFQLAAAGMPFTLWYHAASARVEEVELRGMPLGSALDFPYQTLELQLQPGDALLFMSDGFPELFNPESEILGYDRASALFQEVATRPAKEIIAHLLETGRSWANNQPPNDDITFVVIRRQVLD